MCHSEQKHTQLLEEIEREKHKHHEYMEKSDEFVNLLETDRQKVKLQLEEEKTINDANTRQYEKLKRETTEEIDKLKKFSMLLVEEKQAAMKKDERYHERIHSAEHEILELEETLETLLKKFENEQGHSGQLETEVQELSDKHQQETADLQLQLDAEKKNVAMLEETIETKISQVNKLKGSFQYLLPYV